MTFKKPKAGQTEHLLTLSFDEVLPHVGKKFHDFAGLKKNGLPGTLRVAMSTNRIKLITSSKICVGCGRVADHFRIDYNIHSKAHLNLYGVEGDGLILFTQDHILPKSKGGSNELENLQLMCTKCNLIKSDEVVPPGMNIQEFIIQKKAKQAELKKIKKLTQSSKAKGTIVDELGDRMKHYENRYKAYAMPLAPVIARLDGKAFHTFTKGLKRPYDERMSNLMIATTKYLLETSGAVCGYTQSDEITLVWKPANFKSQIYFDGKIQKLTSILAAMATAYFNKHLATCIPEKADLLPLFDARVFDVPNDEEAVNCFIWREQDAKKNSISMAAHSMFGHAELQNLDGEMMQELMFKKHRVNWNDYPAFFKRGTYIRKRKVIRPLTTEELEALPPKHHARTNPELLVERSVVMQEDWPPLTRIKNRTDVILRGADPEFDLTKPAPIPNLWGDLSALMPEKEAEDVLPANTVLDTITNS